MKRRATRWCVLCSVVAGTVWLGVGCQSDDVLAMRYNIEKRVFDARTLERAAYATYPIDSYPAWERAVNAYTEVLQDDTLWTRASDQWEPAISQDIERLFASAKVGLLRLYALDFRLHAAVTYLPVDDGVVSTMSGSWCEEVPRAARMYAMLDDTRSLDRCVTLLGEINVTPALWRDPSLMRDSLLVIPCQLATPSCDTSGVAGRLLLADDFYSRIISTWPDSSAAAVARRYRATVYARAGRYAEALDDLTALLGIAGADESEMRLIRGEILAFRLGRIEEGRRELNDVVARFPRHHSGWKARLDLALLVDDDASSAGVVERALRQLQLEPGVPDDVASRAMFARATRLEERGEHDQAFLLLWQLCGVYPSSQTALRAPLRIIRHYADLGETERSARAFERACDFYVDLLNRDSSTLKPRYLPIDCLIEACLMSGDVGRAIDLLGERSARWGGDIAAVAGLKTALVCLQILENPEKADENLKKSLAQFPRSRYLTSTCAVSDLVQSARDLDNGQDEFVSPR